MQDIHCKLQDELKATYLKCLLDLQGSAHTLQKAVISQMTRRTTHFSLDCLCLPEQCHERLPE